MTEPSDLSVVLVEPSAAQARFLMGELRELGVTRIQAWASGAEALEAMRREAPRLVFTALYLPDMTGPELIAELRQSAALEGSGVVVVSSETRPQALEPVRQAGVCAILPKPFDRGQLQQALRTALDFLSDAPELQARVDMHDLKVLIVDDSVTARRFIRKVLERLGVQRFLEAQDGRVAAGVLSAEQVDLVVTDYNMPEMDGRQLIEFIRTSSWQSSVPVLMVTSELDQARLAAVTAAGVSGLCDKPFEAETVRRVLSGLLR